MEEQVRREYIQLDQNLPMTSVILGKIESPSNDLQNSTQQFIRPHLVLCPTLSCPPQLTPSNPQCLCCSLNVPGMGPPPPPSPHGTCCSFCLDCSSFRYPDSSLPQPHPVFIPIRVSQRGLPLQPYLRF